MEWDHLGGMYKGCFFLYTFLVTKKCLGEVRCERSDDPFDSIILFVSVSSLCLYNCVYIVDNCENTNCVWVCLNTVSRVYVRAGVCVRVECEVFCSTTANICIYGLFGVCLGLLVIYHLSIRYGLFFIFCDLCSIMFFFGMLVVSNVIIIIMIDLYLYDSQLVLTTCPHLTNLSL